MANELQNFVITASISIIEAMSAIDKMGMGIAFVCQDEVLLATVTDGDIRRFIIGGGSLDSPVSMAANYKFLSLSVDKKNMASYYLSNNIFNAIPVVDVYGKIVEIIFKNKKTRSIAKNIEIPVVMQAGGKGTRLYPYTKILPKPLIPIGEKPIAELIMDNFSECGCNIFTLIVNHKKNMIKAYFSDELNCKYQVSFVDEDIPLGTGGGLALLKDKIDSTFFMTNCDALINEDYSKIYDYHKAGGYIITMVCATKNVGIPYGTVQLGKNGEIASLSEKPSFSFLTNTGFYIIEPNFLDFIPNNTFIHITDAIKKCITNGERVGMFPISENQWSDMGQLGEMEKMIAKEEIQ